MCVVSMIGNHYDELWQPKKWYPGLVNPPMISPGQIIGMPDVYITKDEFNELKRQVEEMKQLLIRAKEYDERNGEPDCEIDEKMRRLRKVADIVGIDLDDVLIKKKDVKK